MKQYDMAFGYSPGLFGLGAGPYAVDMRGDGFTRGTDSHPAIPEAKTIGDFARALGHGLSLGGSAALPGGPSLLGTGLSIGRNAFGSGVSPFAPSNLPDEYTHPMTGFQGLPAPARGGIFDAIRDAFSGGTGGGFSGGLGGAFGGPGFGSFGYS
jgi:hypothetical protein